MKIYALLQSVLAVALFATCDAYNFEKITMQRKL